VVAAHLREQTTYFFEYVWTRLSLSWTEAILDLFLPFSIRLRVW